VSPFPWARRAALSVIERLFWPVFIVLLAGTAVLKYVPRHERAQLRLAPSSAPALPVPDVGVLVGVLPDGEVYRVVDSERGVTCYVVQPAGVTTCEAP
jgi:hypothetical protein